MQISRKPASLSDLECAAIPYAALTAYSALVTSGSICSSESRKGKRVLVVGASGGVGHLACQLLNAWDCDVRYRFVVVKLGILQCPCLYFFKTFGVAKKDSHEFLKILDVRNLLDYEDESYLANLAECKGKG